MNALFNTHPLPWRQMPGKAGFLIDANGAVVLVAIGDSREAVASPVEFVLEVVELQAQAVEALRQLMDFKDSQRVYERQAAANKANAVLNRANALAARFAPTRCPEVVS